MARLSDDPVAWNAYLAEGNAKQARKRVAAHVLFRDEAGRILLVEPTYKPDWELPGGMVEANEPPLEAACREVKEELGLEVRPVGLLCVDWVPPRAPWDDALAFLFDGGTLRPPQIEAIRLLDGEVASVRFCSGEEATTLLRPRLWKRIGVALEGLGTGCTRYLEDGLPSP
jgi:8-oxo-dGTP pyrophosphatase MutT (NUDIX family)